MGRLRTKITAQGQTSVPAEIRQKLGFAPGSTLEWEEQGDHVIVRRAGKYTSLDIHKMLFPDGPPKRKTLKEMDEGIAQYMRGKHARR
jgi:AbrB family looped-hinge helix DNA binding protein